MDLDTIIRFIVTPLLTIACTVVWFMIKKLDGRVDNLEQSSFNIEKDVIEIKTEIRKDIQYLSKDVKEIKDMLAKISK